MLLLLPALRNLAAVLTAALFAAATVRGGDSHLVRAAQAAGLRPQVLRLALEAHARAEQRGETASALLTVIDYTRPSRERRLWVLDLARDSVLERTLVAHGRRTGENLAERFSNRPGSLESSLGTFVTGESYSGKNGYSLRLRGLDRGLNDNAEARAIVIHGAWYATRDFIAKVGRLGRSEGCPALDPAVARRVIDRIKGGTVIFAYYPDPELVTAVRGER
ncbi:MAG: murein L,D-transpeptidase catalytic domain family protein [Deltaproteobacteria bacterium]